LNKLRDRRRDPELMWDESVVADDASGEDRQADRDLARRLVLHAPQRVRVASWLHYVDGLDQSEVADVLQVSRRTVVNRLAGFARYAKRFLSRAG
jgi:RNA polymerase sigma-70 factor (ECF subfamily)